MPNLYRTDPTQAACPTSCRLFGSHPENGLVPTSVPSTSVNTLWNAERGGAHVKVLVRWTTGKILPDRLPNLSLIMLSPPSEQRGPWSSFGAARAYSDVRNNLWGIRFSAKGDFMVDVRFELTTNDPCPADRRSLLRS